MDSSSFPQSLPLPSESWVVCLAGSLAGEDWGKKVIEYLTLHHVPVNQVSCFLLERAHIFPSLPFIINVPIEAFFVALDVPGQI